MSVMPLRSGGRTAARLRACGNANPFIVADRMSKGLPHFLDSTLAARHSCPG